MKTDKKKGREDRNHSPAAAAASVRWLIRNMRCTCFESGSRSWLLLSILTMCTWPRAAARVYLGSRKVRHLSWRRQRKYGRKTVAVRTSRRGVPDPHSSSSTSCRPGPRLQRPVRLNTNAQMSDARAWKQKKLLGTPGRVVPRISFCISHAVVARCPPVTAAATVSSRVTSHPCPEKTHDLL